jgi:hypothetical protein
MVDSSTLQAGRELDKRIALEVMKLPPNLVSIDGPLPSQLGPDSVAEIDHYSTDIRAAWDVVEELRTAGWLVRVQEMPDGFPWLFNGPDEPPMPVPRRVLCLLGWMGHNGEEACSQKDWRRYIHSHVRATADTADTAPLAICRAALEAYEDTKRWAGEPEEGA